MLKSFTINKILYNYNTKVYTAFITALFLYMIGFVMIFLYVPDDYLQKELVKIMYVHVPSAWLSMLSYLLLGISSAAYLITKNPTYDIIAMQLVSVSTYCTVMSLITGSIWGKPAWGTWWAWDARLTSMLLQLFMLIGYLMLRHVSSNNKIDKIDKRYNNDYNHYYTNNDSNNKGDDSDDSGISSCIMNNENSYNNYNCDNATMINDINNNINIGQYDTKVANSCALLAVIGLINLPIIKFSVNLWHTLHQQSSFTNVITFKAPTVDISMIYPLPFITIGMILFWYGVILIKLKTHLLFLKIKRKRLALLKIAM